MLNIFAETFRIATRTDQPWLYQSNAREMKSRLQRQADRENSWFWRGRRWQAPDDPE